MYKLRLETSRQKEVSGLKLNPLKRWNSAGVWEQPLQIKIPFMKKIRAD